MKNRFRTTSRAKFALLVRIVIVTRYRKHVISDRVAKLIRLSIEKLAESANFTVEVMNFEHRNHLHLLISYPPSMAVSALVGRIKQLSSHSVNQNSQIWSSGYFAESTGKISSAKILDYIENQD